MLNFVRAALAVYRRKSMSTQAKAFLKGVVIMAVAGFFTPRTVVGFGVFTILGVSLSTIWWKKYYFEGWLDPKTVAFAVAVLTAVAIIYSTMFLF